jgi:branched-chain amino acid transport system ATP-binding protein
MAVQATTAGRAEPILRLRGVGRRFGGVHAVSDVDLEVRPGERRAILGPNGAGKTTLFNLISGEFPPTAGTVELFDRDVTALPARKRARMGLSRTFQTSRLFLGLTGRGQSLPRRCSASGDGHLRLLPSKRDTEMRESRARWPGPSASASVSTTWSPSSLTASSASSRSGWREPRIPS